LSESSEGPENDDDVNISNVSEKFLMLNSAATEIQKVFKGYLTRKRLDEIY
jgi:hypothetical protein